MTREAIEATVFKAELTVSDIDRHHQATYSLTLACPPSETDAWQMVRLLAFALCADQDLVCGRGLSTHDEPGLSRKGRSSLARKPVWMAKRTSQPSMGLEEALQAARY